MIINATAAHEKAVLFVDIPAANETIPSTRKIVDLFLFFCFIIIPFFGEVIVLA
jgi:hypothetical protein